MLCPLSYANMNIYIENYKHFGWHGHEFRATWLWFRATWLRARWLSGDLAENLFPLPIFITYSLCSYCVRSEPVLLAYVRKRLDYELNGIIYILVIFRVSPVSSLENAGVEHKHEHKLEHKHTSNGPVLLLSNSILRGIQQRKFMPNRYVNKQTITGGTREINQYIERKDFRITPYIYYACRVINYVCTLLFEKTIATP